jgi:glycosyltransferase involved in cell wall biosynthesis
MASGVAVIAPDRGPTTEFASEATALVCDVSNPNAIADSVTRLVTDPALRERLACRGLVAARARSWDAIFDRLLADYLQVIKGVATIHPTQSSS